jgi:hypothetical protein
MASMIKSACKSNSIEPALKHMLIPTLHAYTPATCIQTAPLCCQNTTIQMLKQHCTKQASMLNVRTEPLKLLAVRVCSAHRVLTVSLPQMCVAKHQPTETLGDHTKHWVHVWHVAARLPTYHSTQQWKNK